MHLQKHCRISEISLNEKQESKRTMSVIRTFFDTDLFSEFCNDTHIWFRNGWNDIKKVYSQINMITNSFEGEIQAIVNIDDEMCGHYVDILMHGNIRTNKNTPMVRQVATNRDQSCVRC
ncbi:hypothetical protein RirG_042460 [Rhizophagus irregularis DAOM 197198w]|uniref:Uncharacterized protein n=2 Tax=Rhizophagus irregularis TaxID=588596 RepID=A0A015K729_RHIIW|nr:hypothetical protein RirG_042460 [Rhizophagus irregularis DAOM 197198w]EXX75366.1 hypothetical protein RirG_042460 [Rhizophagus irregularis DAOM 197198w]